MELDSNELDQLLEKGKEILQHIGKSRKEQFSKKEHLDN